MCIPCASKLEHSVVSRRLAKAGYVARLTFSKPKNLSLPSPRRGPALSSSFSSGVTSGALGSFLTGMLPVAGLKGGYGMSVRASHCRWTRDSQHRT